MKRYYLIYESDLTVCRSNKHTWGYANTVSTCKQYIKRCRETIPEQHPRNFKIYDSAGDLTNGFVPCVYSET